MAKRREPISDAVRSAATDELDSGGSFIPEGQATARKAWVARAFERHCQAEPLSTRIARIPADRLTLYRCLAAQLRFAKQEGWITVLDTGCGVGESSISRVRPSQFILGVDKSIVRLRKAEARTPAHAIISGSNVKSLSDDAWQSGLMFAQCDLPELWAVLHHERVRVDQMDFFYPNPWPKPQHFGRRWQGHPGLVDALAIADGLELRTNWSIYAEEFAYAIQLHWGERAQVDTSVIEQTIDRAVSAFERKYMLSGHPLYRVVAQNPAQSKP